MKYLSIIACLVLIVISTNVQAQSNNPWQDKIEPTVWQDVQNDETAEVMLYFDQLDLLSVTSGLETKLEKGNYVYQTLTKFAH